VVWNVGGRNILGFEWKSVTEIFWRGVQRLGAMVVLTFALRSSGLAQVSRLQLVWSDEFSGVAGAAPDSSKWEYDVGSGKWGNQELESYTSERENSALDGKGNLVISARMAKGKFTSARLKTAGKFEIHLGRIEARIRVPFGQGIWPAFWMLGGDVDEPGVGWPKCGEIDIMENIGREAGRVYGTVHGPGYSGAAGISGHVELPAGRRFADDFHIFAVDWTEDSLSFSVDGKEYQRVVKSDIPAGAKWVFDHPFFVLLNVAVGGRWPGMPDATTRFPQELVVDYVRVYGVK
jgi:beta-glucanase (GH16 family)